MRSGVSLHNSFLQAFEKIHSADFKNVSFYTFDGETLCLSALAMTSGFQCDFGVPISLNEEFCIVLTPQDTDISDDAVLTGSEWVGFKKFVHHNQWAYGKAMELRNALLSALELQSSHIDALIKFDANSMLEKPNTNALFSTRSTVTINLLINSNHAIARAYSSLMKLELYEVPRVGEDIVICPNDAVKIGLAQDNYRYRVTKVEYNVNTEASRYLDAGMRQLGSSEILVSAEYIHIDG
jgi:hypothetical protein